MLTIRRSAIAAILVLAATSIAAFGQEPTRERVYFTINSPYQLRKSETVFPAGKYILFQMSENDPDLFALYKDDMKHSPVALIRTISVELPYDKYPEKTKIVLDTDEPRPDTFPVVEGWRVSGMEGLEVNRVVTSHRHISS